MTVQFDEWPKRQQTRREDVVALEAVADDDGAESKVGCCELCGREELTLTFHHLIPKEVHGRFLGKGLPPGIEEAAAAQGLEPKPTREFLNSYGSMLCRFCHSAPSAPRPEPQPWLSHHRPRLPCLIEAAYPGRGPRAQAPCTGWRRTRCWPSDTTASKFCAHSLPSSGSSPLQADNARRSVARGD